MKPHDGCHGLDVLRPCHIMGEAHTHLGRHGSAVVGLWSVRNFPAHARENLCVSAESLYLPGVRWGVTSGTKSNTTTAQNIVIGQKRHRTRLRRILPD